MNEAAVYEKRQAGKLPRSGRMFRLIDLFSGAGGMTLGFTKAFGHRFKPIWANDFDKACAETYNANFGDHCHYGDIVDILESPDTEIPKADVVIGGPPCQGFSLLNKNRRHDPRKQLWRPFLDIVAISEARVFVMENVPQLLDSPEYDQIKEEAERLGFNLVADKLLASDYGVPQHRKRAIIVGARGFDPAPFFPPRKTHGKPANGELETEYYGKPKPYRTVSDVIDDLDPPVGTEIRTDAPPPYDLHFGRNPRPVSVERYMAVPPGGNRFDLQENRPDITPGCWIRKTSGGTDLFGRLWADRPAVTIRTEFFKPEKGRYLHPTQHRPITHREAARFQSFKDEFVFKGTKIEIAKQIGNAVPPLLAARIADSVYAILKSM